MLKDLYGDGEVEKWRSGKFPRDPLPVWVWSLRSETAALTDGFGNGILRNVSCVRNRCKASIQKISCGLYSNSNFYRLYFFIHAIHNPI